MEVVLGIDNLVFIAVLADKLEEAKQNKARRLGLFLAMFVRIAMLMTLGWIMGLTTGLLTIEPGSTLDLIGFDETYILTWRDVILLVGGGYLVYSATREIHDKVEGVEHELEDAEKAGVSFKAVITQIVLMDIIFSLDSVITAVGMVEQGDHRAHWVPLAIMISAVVVAVAVMMWFSAPIANFIKRHPTTKMLALSFLMLIGVMLVAEGLHHHINKGYIYSAMVFSIFVELLNIRAHKKARIKNRGVPADVKT
ncbi:MAG: TerC family protein [Phycisphaera sp.]|nr:TerC family protein [Phycisphaera sp.]